MMSPPCCLRMLTCLWPTAKPNSFRARRGVRTRTPGHSRCTSVAEPRRADHGIWDSRLRSGLWRLQYPAHWEADVVLADGGTAHVRPIRPADAERLRAFYSRLSDESIYFRFFGPRPRLSDREVAGSPTSTTSTGSRSSPRSAPRWSRSSATTGSSRARPRWPSSSRTPTRAGASPRCCWNTWPPTARERGIDRFVADVLPANQKMMGVLRQAGYTPQSRFADGVVRMTLDLAPTETAAGGDHRPRAPGRGPLDRAAARPGLGRGHRRRPRAGRRRPDRAAQPARRRLHRPRLPRAPRGTGRRRRAGLPERDGHRRRGGPRRRRRARRRACSRWSRSARRRACTGLVVVSSGFGETGAEGRARQDELVRIARAYGMRVVGPNCLGIANTDPAVTAQRHARRRPARAGPGGLLQPVGRARHRAAAAGGRSAGMGISTFVSAGNRADVSGNDLLQYWEEDPRPRWSCSTWSRSATRASSPGWPADSPAQADRGGQERRHTRAVHSARRRCSRLPDTRDQLAVRAGRGDPGRRPHPAVRRRPSSWPTSRCRPGPRVGAGRATPTRSACSPTTRASRAGLEPRPPVNLGATRGRRGLRYGPRGQLASPDGRRGGRDLHAAHPRRRRPRWPPSCCGSRAGSAKPVLATFQGHLGMPPDLRVGGRGSRAGLDPVLRRAGGGGPGAGPRGPVRAVARASAVPRRPS